MDVVTTML